jgi:hypothetical protein
MLFQHMTQQKTLKNTYFHPVKKKVLTFEKKITFAGSFDSEYCTFIPKFEELFRRYLKCHN